MERIFFMIAGGCVGLYTLFYIVRLAVLRLTGIEKEAEVVAVKEPKQGSYVHTLRFEFDGKIVEKDDRTGYSQPFSKGDRKKIVCSRKSPDRFEYAEALGKNIIIAAVLVVMSVLVVVRFAFLKGEL